MEQIVDPPIKIKHIKKAMGDAGHTTADISKGKNSSTLSHKSF